MLTHRSPFDVTNVPYYKYESQREKGRVGSRTSINARGVGGLDHRGMVIGAPIKVPMVKSSAIALERSDPGLPR